VQRFITSSIRENNHNGLQTCPYRLVQIVTYRIFAFVTKELIQVSGLSLIGSSTFSYVSTKSGRTAEVVDLVFGWSKNLCHIQLKTNNDCFLKRKKEEERSSQGTHNLFSFLRGTFIM
jgi:hypothetical protein